MKEAAAGTEASPTRLLESKADFARRLGVARSTVTRDAAAGRLVLVGDRVDVHASLARRRATRGGRTDVADRHAAARHTAQPAPGADSAHAASPSHHRALQNPTAPDSDDAVALEESRVRHQADRVHFENMLIRLGMDYASGLRFHRRAVGREAEALGVMLSSCIMRVIDQTAPRLAVITDFGESERLLRSAIAREARAVRAEPFRSLRRLRDAGDKP